jgi:hypothetical protein
VILESGMVDMRSVLNLIFKSLPHSLEDLVTVLKREM